MPSLQAVLLLGECVGCCANEHREYKLSGEVQPGRTTAVRISFASFFT